MLSGLVAGDSAICGRVAALILRLRPAGVRFEEFRSPVRRGGLGLRFSNRELVAISVRVEAAGDVAAQIASDLRPRVEGH